MEKLNNGKMNLQVMICKTCIDFKNERDYYYRKCKDYEWKLAEYEVKNAEEQRKLQESQKEIKLLKELISRFDNLEDVSNILPSENYTESQLIVPKLEPPDVDDSEECAPLTCEMEIKMEPEVVLEEGDNDTVNQSECDVESDESDSPEPNSPQHTKRSQPIEMNCDKYLCSSEQKFYQICRWTVRSTDGSSHVCKKMFNVSDLTNHIAQAHAGRLQATCSWENCPMSDKPFRSTAHLLEHVHCHLFQAKYRCSVPDCGQPFFLEHHLKKHMFTHMSVTEKVINEQYTCPYNGCGMVLPSANYLRRHMVVHMPVQTANPAILKFST